RQPEVLVEHAARLLEVDVCKWRVVRGAGGNHHVIDGCRQLVEEPREAIEVRRVEGRTAHGSELARRVLEALRVPGREDHVGALGPRSTGGFEPDSGAAADHHDGLPGELRLVAHALASSGLAGSELLAIWGAGELLAQQAGQEQ